MKERLTALKMKLNLKWSELADKMGISVAMLGFLRRGVRRPTRKILATVEALESATKTTTKSQALQQSLQQGAIEVQHVQALEAENRRLKEEVSSLRGEIRGLQFALDRLSQQQPSCA